MTIDELTEKFITDLKKSNDKLATFKNINKTIESLKYENGNYLTDSDKKSIFIRIDYELFPKKGLTLTTEDNKDYLVLVADMINKLGG